MLITVLNGRLVMKKYIFLLLIILTVSASAQENWGLAESIVADSWLDYCPMIMYGFKYPSISSNDSLMFLVYDCIDTSGMAYSTYENGEWQIPEVLQGQIYLDYPMPIFYYDLGDTLLYFTSEMDGGYGGQDIWAIQSINGVWTEPFSLGPVINTGAHEGSPSLPDDASRLYFIRGDVIVYSDIINGQYTDPIALPSNINSDLTEAHPRISRDGQKLYFNRYGNFLFPDTLMVSYYSNGIWQQPFALNSHINYNNSQYCPTIPPSSFGPSFNLGGSKMYFSRFEVWGFFCDPVFDVFVSELVTGIDPPPFLTPSSFSISAYPNPFNNQTNISIDATLESISDIAVYDITGRKIRSFKPSPQITWDGNDDAGSPISSGIYFVKVTTESAEKSLRITYLK